MISSGVRARDVIAVWLPATLAEATLFPFSELDNLSSPVFVPLIKNFPEDNVDKDVNRGEEGGYSISFIIRSVS